MRLIDADELNDYVMDTYGGGITDNTVIFYGDVLTIINEAPTVDAVEVVRCKDCEHYCDGTWCDINEAYFEDDDFCSYGERKENRG